MSQPLLESVSDKLNTQVVTLLSSARACKILGHYVSWLSRSGHDTAWHLSHATSRAVHDICGRNGLPGIQRTEPRL